MDTSFPPDARVENEASTLMEAGHEVILFCIDYPGGVNLFGATIEREEVGGVQVVRHSGSRLMYKLSALVYTIPLWRWWITPHIRRFIEDARLDLLHIHDMVIAEAALEANRQFDLPVVLDLHENRPAIMELYKHVNSPAGRWLIDLNRWERKQRELMQRVDHVILVTEEARGEAERSAGIPMERTTSIPNVVRLKTFDPLLAEPEVDDSADSSGRLSGGAINPFTLLYIGDTSLRRGTMTALEAVDRARHKIPELQLILVGASSQDDQLKRYVERNRLHDRVTFAGWQPPARLPGYIRSADLCLSPLLRNLHHDTTYANKLFQYMAGGRAVLVSDCTAQAAVVRSERCGLIHRAGDAEDLARAIERLYNNPDETKAMGHRGREAVEARWCWEVTGPRLLSVHASLA